MKYSFLDLITETIKLGIHVLSRLVPKKNIWIFGSWYGLSYNDNSKYFFEYMCQNHPEVRCIWVTRSKLAATLIQKKGFEVYYSNSLMAVWSCLQAKVAVTCIGDDVFHCGYALSPNVRIIQLWHGVGPKGYATRKMQTYWQDEFNTMDFQSRVINKLVVIIAFLLFRKWYHGIKWLPYNTPKFSLAFTTSRLGKEKLRSALLLDPSKIIVSGYPRHDALIHKTTDQVPLNRELLTKSEQGWTICLYAPTHREPILKNLSEMLTSLYDKLSQATIHKKLILIKLHAGVSEDLPILHKLRSLKNVRLVSDTEIHQDIYTIFQNLDVLITDYSSIYTDFLLTEKPLIFVAFDQQQYEENGHGFFVKYASVTPGPIASDWSQVFSLLDRLSDIRKKYARQRADCLAMYHEKRDGKSSSRIYAHIQQLLK